MKPLSYTGVGSRETPPEELLRILDLGRELGEVGLVLRTGDATGADLHFRMGASQTAGPQPEVYAPAEALTREPPSYQPTDLITRYQVDLHLRAESIARRHHPKRWPDMHVQTRLLHTRNVFQVLGANLDLGATGVGLPVDPSLFLVCWTPDGADGSLSRPTSRKTGGTGQAIRIAHHYGMPVFNLQAWGSMERLKGTLMLLIEHAMKARGDQPC